MALSEPRLSALSHSTAFSGLKISSLPYSTALSALRISALPYSTALSEPMIIGLNKFEGTFGAKNIKISAYPKLVSRKI